MNNLENISKKFKELRFERIKNWRPRLSISDYDYLFPIERAFLKRINEKLEKNSIPFFSIINYNYSENPEFHKYLSYLIEALDVLPLKLDLAFDFLWKSLELFMKEAYTKTTRNQVNGNTALLLHSNYNYWTELIETTSPLKSALNDFIKIFPSQSYEYLAKRIFKNYSRNFSLHKRLTTKNGQTIEEMQDLLDNIYKKYGDANDGETTRKIGRLLYKLLNGETIFLPNRNEGYYLSTYHKLNLIAGGLLYTYRNDRFHASSISPFKSSRATLKTYSHSHYMFLWTYYLTNITLIYLDNIELPKENVVKNIKENNNIFSTLYGRILKK